MKKRLKDEPLGTKLRRGGKDRVPVVWTMRPEVLLCPQTPAPLHGVVPREILGAKWWNATRRAAYRSTDYHCVACGVAKADARYHRWLEGHEVYDVDYLLGRAHYKETVPLCHFCHNYIHQGRLRALLEQGLVHHAKYVAIVQHGDEVLSTVGLVKNQYAGPTVEWGEWRLVLFGVEYPPKYKNSKVHDRAMARNRRPE